MNLPEQMSPAGFLAIGVAIGAALGVALDNMVFLGAGVAIGAALMAVQTSRQGEQKDSEPGDREDSL